MQCKTTEHMMNNNAVFHKLYTSNHYYHYKSERSLGQIFQEETKWPQDVPGEIQVGYYEKFLKKSGQVLEQSAQAGGGVAVHGGVQEMFRSYTKRWGLAGKYCWQVALWTR